MYGVDFENPWLTSVDSAGRRLPAWAAALGSVAFAAAVLLTFKAIGGGLVTALADLAKNLPKGWDIAVAQGILQILVFAAFLVVAAVGMRIEGRRVRGLPGRGATWIFAGLMVGALGFCIAVAIAWTAGAVEIGAEAALAPLAASLVFGLVLVGFQALAEEVFFRAWLQPLLSIQWGPWVGLIVTSVLFAGLHVISGVGGVLAVLNLFLGGMLFGLLALRSGGLAAPVAAHFAWNWTETGGLALSSTPTNGLVSLHLHGPAIWSGGVDTMNGSLSTTMVLAALVALLTVIPATRFAPRAEHRFDRVL